MPKWCSIPLTIRGDSENIKEFTKCFIYGEDIKKNRKDKNYLAITFCDYQDHKDLLESEKRGIEEGQINILLNCAWSCWSCWFEGYPEEFGLPTMEELTKKYKIHIEGTSVEEGMCFEEGIKTDENYNVLYNSWDMPKYKCKNCKKTSPFPSDLTIDELNGNERCYHCDKNTEWEKAE